VRVTAIEPSGNLYGSEKALFDIIRGSASRGVQWDVILPLGGEFQSLLASAGIPTSAILTRESHTVDRWKKIRGYIRLALHLATRRPDLIYLNQAGMLRAVSAIAGRLGIPLVCQIQTLEDARFIASSKRLRTAATSFICNSRFIAEASNVPRERLSTFYQPLMGETEPTNVKPPQPGPWKIGVLGRIARSKGHYVFLDAARELVSRGRDDIQFVVIGEGLSTEDTLEFKRAVDANGLTDNFELRGFRSDVAHELNLLHALVMPSLAEPLGRVVLDACRAQRPIIVSDSGGLGEFSRALDVGIRVRAGDPTALASSIAQTLDNYDAEYERFQRAAERAKERLGAESYLDAVQSVLSDAANGHHSSLEWFGDAP
jgi:glycosyltransferase involved in cell wall biosynthesis